MASTHQNPSAVTSQRKILIHTAQALLASPSTATHIINLINKGYQDPSAYPSSTDASTRFRDPSHLHSALGENGLVAVAYGDISSASRTGQEGGEEQGKKEGEDENGDRNEDENEGSEMIACACAAEWTGDLGGLNSGKEDGGYEIKAVTSSPLYRKSGLVNACLEALTKELVGREKEKRTKKVEEGKGNGVLKVWVHAVEEYNGPYWRKKGWEYVRGYDMPAGHYISPNSVTGFRLILLLKEVEVL